MAPVPPPNRDEVERTLKAIIQNFYNLLVQSLDYQEDNNTGRDVLKQEFAKIQSNLQTLFRTASTIDIHIPPHIVKFVEEGRNPDILQRQFVEQVQKFNQKLNGRAQAYADFRDILAKDLQDAFPGMRGNLEHTVRMTGGRVPLKGVMDGVR
ncbi:hypothetical protein EJ05DRAFT_510714 [Pseudovirgaria hyperparasitica]|uniref:Mediator of RNA polymerase II transcription subunit 10 n=1 Tax=Pseudovirgaria hyperparasitica TaxID=470096 RepID=A0A6A6W9Q6_9PEZI|nr:uncharacterized protein EJ05DRAFT_510714 [Pseudovirgaria hyperparasitica]KAF2757831.1 hypothetical protein EJ05DRAFT_510714 [Pseudovirgaria hyperparasitica]